MLKRKLFIGIGLILCTALMVPTFAESMSVEKFCGLCAKGKPGEVKDAIKGGVDVNVKDGDGFTPLMVAAGKNSNVDVVKVLIESGSNVNMKDDDGCTPLMWAAQQNSNSDIIIALVKAGANVNNADKFGFTALSWAVSKNPNAEVTKALLKFGANINITLVQNKFVAA